MQLKHIDSDSNIAPVTIECEGVCQTNNQITLNPEDLLLLETAITERYLIPTLSYRTKCITRKVCLMINGWRQVERHIKPVKTLSKEEASCILSSIRFFLSTIPPVFTDELNIVKRMLTRFKAMLPPPLFTP